MNRPLMMQEVSDPQELGRARAQRERFDRNVAWFRSHAAEIFDRYRGKCVCIAGEEAFAAATPEEALALGAAAHPEDDGRFVELVPRDRRIRIYAHRRRMAPVP